MTKEIKLNLDKDKKYVVACSFGPDSMALLHACLQSKLNVVVAHVNYRKRDVSLSEQLNLEKYCNEYGIPFYALDLLGIKSEGNFQEWARETRYKFFKKVCEEVGASGVLVAHQQDDSLETYLMQKKRGIFVKNTGISSENEIFGIRVIRPLLEYSKAFLKQYDDDRKIPYSIDESNLTDHYTRNKIRHHIIEQLSEEERINLLEEMKATKKDKVEIKNVYDYNEFKKLNYEQLIQILDYFMEKISNHRDLSKKYVDEIQKAFSSRTNIFFNINKEIRLEKDYNKVFILNTNKLKDYKYEFEREFKNELLDINFSSGLGDRKEGLKLEKYFVKNLSKKDKYIIKDYNVKVDRLFIDWKMPLFLREIWPGIYTENNELIYIPRYREKYEDKHDSKLKIYTEIVFKFDA